MCRPVTLDGLIKIYANGPAKPRKSRKNSEFLAFSWCFSGAGSAGTRFVAGGRAAKIRRIGDPEGQPLGPFLSPPVNGEGRGGDAVSSGFRSHSIPSAFVGEAVGSYRLPGDGRIISPKLTFWRAPSRDAR